MDLIPGWGNGIQKATRRGPKKKKKRAIKVWPRKESLSQIQQNQVILLIREVQNIISTLKPIESTLELLLKGSGASPVAQRLRIRLPMQGTQVRALVQEDPTCRGATKPVRHNYWTHVPQLLKPMRLEPMLRNKRTAMRRLRTTRKSDPPTHLN